MASKIHVIGAWWVGSVLDREKVGPTIPGLISL